MLKRIFEEAEPDFSAEVCSEAALDDLDPAAIRQFRSRWAKKSKNKSLAGLPAEQLLADAELVVSKGVTYAALILLAKARSLGRLLAQAEVIFEYRSTEAAGPANQREEFRQGFFLFYDRLWDLIDLRNDRQHFQEGFFMNEIPTFSEGSVREAILNAVSHRDYRHPGSVFIRQFPRRVEIVSPGGFPPGISPENILDEQLPRNRRIAETFARCDLVERAGQGVNRMFEECIRQGKPLPDYSGSNDYHVLLRLRGQIQDENFLRFLDRVGDERLRAFSTHDFLVIDLVHREQPVPEGLLLNVQMLVEQGIIESVPRARTRQYRLSPQYYELRRKETTAPGKRGTAREKDKAIALRILKSRKKTGVRLREFRAALPELSRDQVHRLMQSLRIEGLAHNRGSTRASLWFLGPAPKIARPGKKPRNRRA
jgi:ATP-dependent DNA helicase RecG